MKIPGLSFSWTNLVCLPCGRRTKVSKLKRDFAKATGIPTTRNGIECKTVGAIVNTILGKKK